MRLAQTIVACLFALNSTSAQNWEPTSSPSLNWRSLACSADGAKIVAGVENGYGGGGLIYASTNSGETWAPVNVTSNAWNSISSSTDGVILAAAPYPGPIFVSTNSGANWTSNSSPNEPWVSIASSADGTKLVAVWNVNSSNGGIYSSRNSGATWMLDNVPNSGWFAVASSADGSKLAAAIAIGSIYNGPNPITGIYTSKNYGATWTNTTAPTEFWVSIASSADGTKLVAAAHNFEPYQGQIYTSTDSGSSWSLTTAPIGNWERVVSSADGTNLMASQNTGQIYTSTDAGGTWVQVTNIPSAQWYSLASSADGSKLVATAEGGKIYTSPSERLLTAAPFMNDIILSWTTNAVGFILQENPDLATSNWLTVTNTPTEINSENQIILPLINSSGFYRLAPP